MKMTRRNPAAWQVIDGCWRLAWGICLEEGYQSAEDDVEVKDVGRG